MAKETKADIDIRRVREFLERELAQRQQGGGQSYIQRAKVALESFERLAETHRNMIDAANEIFAYDDREGYGSSDEGYDLLAGLRGFVNG